MSCIAMNTLNFLRLQSIAAAVGNSIKVLASQEIAAMRIRSKNRVSPSWSDRVSIGLSERWQQNLNFAFGFVEHGSEHQNGAAHEIWCRAQATDQRFVRPECEKSKSKVIRKLLFLI